MLIWILTATFVVSLVSLVGIFAFVANEKILKKILFILVGFSAGALMGGAFFHLIPEAIEELSPSLGSIYILIGFCIFFIIERFLHWHHCHKGRCDAHTFTYMNLIGDSIHNFVDGLIIAASFIISIPLGIAATIAVIAHEIPQEMGDFAVLVYGGFSKTKALLFNFLTALTAIVGALFGYVLSNLTKEIIPFILLFAAGGFIYIAASDLVPELHKEKNMKKSLYSFGFFRAGILLMWIIKFIFEH